LPQEQQLIFHVVIRGYDDHRHHFDHGRDPRDGLERNGHHELNGKHGLTELHLHLRFELDVDVELELRQRHGLEWIQHQQLKLQLQLEHQQWFDGLVGLVRFHRFNRRD
jgi:hypothetical protein